MKKSDFEKLVHECQLEVDEKNQAKMENFLSTILKSAADDSGMISTTDADRAVYYAASKLAVGLSTAITAKIIERLGIVSFED